MHEPRNEQTLKKTPSQRITIRTCHETLALIHAQYMFCSHKSTLVQTITLTYLGLNAETCTVKYYQDRDFMHEPRNEQT